MFDILFGRRKASKCKKLVKTVQCRLMLLKNKRLCIVKILREDVAELLKHGYHHTAFQRVEQVIMDESMVQVCDLLYQFCELLLPNISYMLKHRDCPNDINEAVSTLIFSSERIGQLPELLSIRRMFGKHYGESFVTNAIELLPGNLVNNQIIENLYNIKKVSDDVKYKLLDEIASSFVQPGRLFLEYKPELQEDQQETKGEVELDNIEKETQEKIIIHMDNSSSDEYTKTSILEPSSLALGKELILSNPIQDSDPRRTEKKLMLSEYCNTRDSSPETSFRLPEEIVYLDDIIEDFSSPQVSKDGICLNETKIDYGIQLGSDDDKQNLFQERWISKNPKNKKKASRKGRSRRRRRRTPLSQENRNIDHIECATYYGESEMESPDCRRRLSNRILVCERQTSDESESEEFTMHSLKDRDVQYGLQLCKYSHTDERASNELPPLRWMSMPVERPNKENVVAHNMNRSKSFPSELSNASCKHVHPKLPDYDEIAAKFTEIKRANLQRKQQLNNA